MRPIPRWMLWALIVGAAMFAWFGCAGNGAASNPAPAFDGAKATVAAMGDCPDVSAPTCAVRPWWLRGRMTEATGLAVYWLASREGRVCFVEWKRYTEAVVGRESSCLWRERQL